MVLMNIDNIKTIFNEKREVHFKLYSLDYTIKEDNGKILIYADLYDNNGYIFVRHFVNSTKVFTFVLRL